MYGGNTYSQLEGVAMGSPISPIVADIVMQKALQQILTTGERPLRIDFIRKYVDDLLLAVHKDDVCRILEIFNAFHTRIQFTMEIEEQGTLAYLDLRIHRMEGGQMYTTWYSKPCASHRMLNYTNLAPDMQQK
uniref:Reverse transcriptase domain-containing protein n=1 Tax=Lutzomyia longipalpis TaxID=7200 RepID=A0A1B0CHE8_LUTLO